ncbi:MAG: hypothetical protein AAGI89_09950 [Pseudomonadota bacterium]
MAGEDFSAAAAKATLEIEDVSKDPLIAFILERVCEHFDTTKKNLRSSRKDVATANARRAFLFVVHYGAERSVQVGTDELEARRESGLLSLKRVHALDGEFGDAVRAVWSAVSKKFDNFPTIDPYVDASYGERKFIRRERKTARKLLAKGGERASAPLTVQVDDDLPDMLASFVEAADMTKREAVSRAIRRFIREEIESRDLSIPEQR